MRDEIEDRYLGFGADMLTSMGKCWFEATTIGLSKDTIWGKAETQTSHTHTRTGCGMFHHLWVTGCMWMHSVGSAWNNETVNVELSEQVSSGPGSSGRSGANTHTNTNTLYLYAARTGGSIS